MRSINASLPTQQLPEILISLLHSKETRVSLTFNSHFLGPCFFCLVLCNKTLTSRSPSVSLMEHKPSQLYIVSDFELTPTIFLPYFSPRTSMCLSVSSCLSLPSEASKCQTRVSSIVRKMLAFTCTAAHYLRLIRYK